MDTEILIDDPAPRRRTARPAAFDAATVLGALCAFGLVFLAIILGGRASAFFDLNSLLIVLGGTLGGTLINFPLEDFRKTGHVLRNALYPENSPAELRVQKLIELARRARSGGVLSLEHVVYHEPDPFFRKAIQLLVDGLQADDIRRTLELELRYIEDRHRRGAQLFQAMGGIAPAMGLIGTLIGLVQMLQSLDDPARIGPGMATALLTTFYGAMLSYVIFLPLAGKLRTRSREEARIKELTIEGVLAIQTETNPRLIEQRLMGFLPPEARLGSYG